jgi:predicted transcriptional regulator
MRRTSAMYSPKVKEELVRELYQLKQQTKRPMTRMVNEAIEEYFERRKNNYGKDEENQLETFAA